MRYFEVLSAALLALVGVAHACSPVEGFQAQSIEERARVPQSVVYGTVVGNHTPVSSDLGVDQAYSVQVQPMCWLKRGGRRPSDHERSRREALEKFKNITVVEEALCIFNNLTQGKKYIMFLMEGTFSNFTISNVNTEPGVFKEPTDDTFEAVYRGISAGLMGGDPDGECLDGVEIPCFTGEKDLEVCNGGVTVGVVLWFLISAIALTISVY